MSTKIFIGFVEGASHHTCNLASAAWVIYAPIGQLVTSRGTYLGLATNNMAEYSSVIELLRDVALHGISCLKVRLDSQLVVSHLNGDYEVRHPSLLCQFFRIRLLARHFDYIIY